MEQEILVLGWKGFDFLDDKNKQVTGSKVHYVFLNGSNEQLAKGNLPMAQSFDLQFSQSLLTVVPAIYKAKFDLVPGKGGKANLQITSLTLVNDVNFSELNS